MAQTMCRDCEARERKMEREKEGMTTVDRVKERESVQMVAGGIFVKLRPFRI